MTVPACAVCNGDLNLLSQVGAATPLACARGEQLPTRVLLAQDYVDHHEHGRAGHQARVSCAAGTYKLRAYGGKLDDK
jgi:hypothetical protein